MQYTIQVSNHPEAARRIPTQAAVDSWRTVFDGKTTAKDAKRAVEQLAGFYRNARAFRGAEVGKLWYAVLQH